MEFISIRKQKLKHETIIALIMTATLLEYSLSMF